MNKREKIIAGLIGVGAVVLLVYLIKQQQGGAIAGTVVPSGNADASPGTYPNSSPIDPGSFVVQGSPQYLSYNIGAPLPDVALTAPDVGGCGCDPCGDALMLQTVQRVPPDVAAAALKNFKSYKAKTVTATATNRPTDAQIIAQDFGTQGQA